MTIRLKENTDYLNLPEIKAGDSVRLEKADWAPFIMEALVTNRNEEDGTYVCKVTNILYRQTLEPVRGNDPLGLMNENILVERRYIQAKK